MIHSGHTRVAEFCEGYAVDWILDVGLEIAYPWDLRARLLHDSLSLNGRRVKSIGNGTSMENKSNGQFYLNFGQNRDVTKGGRWKQRRSYSKSGTQNSEDPYLSVSVHFSSFIHSLKFHVDWNSMICWYFDKNNVLQIMNEYKFSAHSEISTIFIVPNKE